MSDENLIFIAITVFILMIVGLVLTALEFRFGEPHRQEEEAEHRAGHDAHSQSA